MLDPRLSDIGSSTPARPDSRSPCESIPSLRSKRKPDHLRVTRDHPMLTLVSMIGPSPDWFVGVSRLSLLGGGQWRTQHSGNLYPYDAGTENGEEFSLSNPATSPQGTISSIRGMGKFSNEPMATLSFVRKDTPPPPPLRRPGERQHRKGAGRSHGPGSGTLAPGARRHRRHRGAHLHAHGRRLRDQHARPMSARNDAQPSPVDARMRLMARARPRASARMASPSPA